jgi:hypothetical protein
MEAIKPRIMKKELILQHFEKIKSNIPKNKEFDLRDGVEMEYFGDKKYGLENVNLILFDGIGYGVGNYEKDNTLKMFMVSYPFMEDLTVEQKIMIIEYLGLDSDSINDLSFGDCFMLFGKMKELMYEEKLN